MKEILEQIEKWVADVARRVLQEALPQIKDSVVDHIQRVDSPELAYPAIAERLLKDEVFLRDLADKLDDQLDLNGTIKSILRDAHVDIDASLTVY